jgi:hypothetical protein
MARLYAVRGEVERDEGNEPLAEELADDLADAPEAGNDDVIPELASLAFARLQRLRKLGLR